MDYLGFVINPKSYLNYRILESPNYVKRIRIQRHIPQTKLLPPILTSNITKEFTHIRSTLSRLIGIGGTLLFRSKAVYETFQNIEIFKNNNKFLLAVASTVGYSDQGKPIVDLLNTHHNDSSNSRFRNHSLTKKINFCHTSKNKKNGNITAIASDIYKELSPQDFCLHFYIISEPYSVDGPPDDPGRRRYHLKHLTSFSTISSISPHTVVNGTIFQEVQIRFDIMERFSVGKESNNVIPT